MNYKKQIISEVLEHPAFKAVSRDLDDDQKKKIEARLNEFVSEFSEKLLTVMSAAQRDQATKSEIQKHLDEMTGSVK